MPRGESCSLAVKTFFVILLAKSLPSALVLRPLLPASREARTYKDLRMNNTLFKSTLLLAAAAFVASATAQTEFDTARASLEKWVETRQLISKEKSDWDLESEALADSIALLKAELATLEENISKAEGDTTAADVEREKLMIDNDALKGASSTVAGLVAGVEARIQKMIKALPEDLRSRPSIQLLSSRIPKNPQTSRASLSERMQNIVGILTEVEKFNSSVTFASETRKVPSGETVQVSTIYVGLGQGYYVDATRKFAGVLTPSADGWTATDRNDLATLIGDVLDLYNKTKQPPQFVKIPVEIK